MTRHIRISESSLVAHARIAAHVVIVVLDNGPREMVVATVRSLYDTELFGARSYEDPDDAMRTFVNLVSLALTPRPSHVECEGERDLPCQCGKYTACCAADLDVHVCLMMTSPLDDRQHGRKVEA